MEIEDYVGMLGKSVRGVDVMVVKQANFERSSSLELSGRRIIRRAALSRAVT